jgi:hypothetical protein
MNSMVNKTKELGAMINQNASIGVENRKEDRKMWDEMMKKMSDMKETQNKRQKET